MATEKPRLVVYTDQETIERLDSIAKSQNRSRGNMAETIIKQYLDDYEQKHGKLNTELSISKIG